MLVMIVIDNTRSSSILATFIFAYVDNYDDVDDTNIADDIGYEVDCDIVIGCF